MHSLSYQLNFDYFFANATVAITIQHQVPLAAVYSINSEHIGHPAVYMKWTLPAPILTLTYFERNLSDPS